MPEIELEIIETETDYATNLVIKAADAVMYRKWRFAECSNLDDRFYLFCDGNKIIHLVRVGKLEMFPITGNENWRQDAPTWIRENMADDPLSDFILARTCIKFGEAL